MAIRQLFTSHIPALTDVLVVESGPREVTEKFLLHLYEVQQSRRVDVVTCFGSPPAKFDASRGICYSIHDAAYKGKRSVLIQKLSKESAYSAVSLLCTGSPIMSKWKWAIATQASAKTLIVNENADFFFLDWRHRHVVQRLISSRVGMHGGVSLGIAAEVLVTPFTIGYLVLSTAGIHLRRILR